ncbi:MAG: host attachment protein [Legionellaceae bacterium]|nr:host attachment protein [Legionellaceae bacterium]
MSSNQRETWVLATNTNMCRLYCYSKRLDQLTLLKEIQHPENKLRDSELTSDKPGHYQTSGTARGAYSQRTDPKEIKIEDFSREIAKELNCGRSANTYEHLIVSAAPHMNGLLFQHLNKHVKNLVTHNIKKDVMHFNERELLVFLHQHNA